MKQVESYKLKVKNIFNKPLTLNFPLLTISKGFTLIEIVMIIVIASIAIPTLLLLLGQQAKYGVDAEIRVTEINLAQQLMEEIKSKCWDESKIVGGVCTGPGTGSALGTDGTENRTACTGATTDPFDDVDDYDNYSETCSWGGSTYTRSVDVCYVPSGDLNDTSTCNTATNYKRISVSVNNPANSQSVEVVTVVTNY